MNNLFKYFFSFYGKITRKQYILPFIIFTLTFVVVNSLIRRSDEVIIILLFSLFILISFLSFTSRRLRDINVSYLWMLSVLITPLFFIVCLVLCFIPSKKITSEVVDKFPNN